MLALFQLRIQTSAELSSAPQPLPPGRAILPWGWQRSLGLLEQDVQLLNLFVLAHQLLTVCFHLSLEHTDHLPQCL
jgi:hypothetical protein